MKSFLIAALLGAMSLAVSAQTKWDLPTGYAVGSFQTENVQQFASEVERLSGGKLKITLHPNGSLYKANEIKRAVQSGQTQAGEFLLSSAANENALFGVDSIPFLADSYADAKRLADIARPYLEKLYESVKYFYSVNAWLPKNAIVVSKQAFDA